jgi:4-oxalocrotonate tautomerase family enzyme
MAHMVYLKDVVTLKLDPDKCTGCGTCLTVCPRGVLKLADRKALIFEKDACIECGACMLNCPDGAIAVRTGVGCASAVINSYLGRTDGTCCCVIDEPKSCCAPEWSEKEGEEVPFVNIRITKEGLTAEKKAALIRGATQLLVDVLGKNPQTTFVIIDEVDTDNWGIGGDSVTARRKRGQ